MIGKLICKLFGHRFRTFIYGNLGGGDYSVVKCSRCGLLLNETVAEIVKCIRQVAHNAATANKETKESWRPTAFLATVADRIEAAHRREVAELKRLHDIHAKQAFRDFDRKLFFRDKRIAELRECLKPILAVHLCDGGTQPVSDALCAVAECKSRWRKALEGAKDEEKNY